MPQIKLDHADANELAELLTFLTGWLTADPDTLDASLTRYVGHPAYGLGQLGHDLHRFAFLLGGNAGEPLFNPPC
jgi:hypothetical protein